MSEDSSNTPEFEDRPMSKAPLGLAASGYLRWNAGREIEYDLVFTSIYLELRKAKIRRTSVAATSSTGPVDSVVVLTPTSAMTMQRGRVSLSPSSLPPPHAPDRSRRRRISRAQTCLLLRSRYSNGGEELSWLLWIVDSCSKMTTFQATSNVPTFQLSWSTEVVDDTDSTFSPKISSESLLPGIYLKFLELVASRPQKAASGGGIELDEFLHRASTRLSAFMAAQRTNALGRVDVVFRLIYGGPSANLCAAFTSLCLQEHDTQEDSARVVEGREWTEIEGRGRGFGLAGLPSVDQPPNGIVGAVFPEYGRARCSGSLETSSSRVPRRSAIATITASPKLPTNVSLSARRSLLRRVCWVQVWLSKLLLSGLPSELRFLICLQQMYAR
ncbi:hypothetical protein R3P38DRAFT_2786682 [Favolaschia claudopus]|uniref:Uncharacterized protein n=1 Tax=Favolaschia claudopus TaxID=2862362 RepID=A0AAW0ASE1_9AGAR